MLSRLRRITDLFIEGRELVLGLDNDGSAIIVWVNKPNSFEVEEARRDGQAARADRILELKDPANPEVVSLNDAMERWSFDELVEARLNQATDVAWLEAANDIESITEWREKLDYLQRMPQILADAKAEPDDARRERLSQYNQEYLDEIGKRLAELQANKRSDLSKMDAADLREEFREAWRDKVSLDVYMQEKRVTEVAYALRDCSAVRDTEAMAWDHSSCDGHLLRLLPARADVRTLPDEVLNKVIGVLDDLEIGQRAAGNWVAPESSSASSEQPKVAEDSTASTPEETSDESTTT